LYSLDPSVGGIISTFLQNMRYALRMLVQYRGFHGHRDPDVGSGNRRKQGALLGGKLRLLNPLPYPQAYHWLRATPARRPLRSRPSAIRLLSTARNNRSLASIAAYRSDDFNLAGAGEPESVRTEMISADSFSGATSPRKTRTLGPPKSGFRARDSGSKLGAYRTFLDPMGNSELRTPRSEFLRQHHRLGPPAAPRRNFRDEFDVH